MRRFLAFLFFFLSIPPATPAENFLILPFFNLSGNESLDWIGESISETVSETLTNEGLLVVDRDAREEAYRRLALRNGTPLTRASVIKLGELLDAGQVVHGRYELLPSPPGAGPQTGALRISAQILDLRRLQRGPEFMELGALQDLAALENHLSWQTLQFVAPKQAPAEEEFRKRRPVLRVDAMEHYVRGLLARDPETRLRLFTVAAKLDPRYSQPCFQLGRLFWQKKDYRTAAQWFERVSPVDSHFREATFLRGLCKYYSGDYAGAQAAFEMVVKEVPLNEVQNNLGAAQLRRNLPEAEENFRRAIEGDPGDPVYHFNLGYALWKKGAFEEAARSFRVALEREPGDAAATLMLGRCLQKSGPRAGDARTEGLERLKHDYEEAAWWQLRALMGAGNK